MKNLNKIKIKLDSTVRNALKTISNGGIRIALVVNNKNKLLGTITDGDIRRGFLNGLNLDSPINSIIFKKPIVAKENDPKEKLLKIALSHKIFQFPVVDENFKVIGIRVINELIQNKNKSNTVVVMAGGKGERLRPLTKDTPKPMLKIGGKPILQIILEKFKQSGYENFVICVKYKSKVITDYFGNGLKFGVKIEYIREKNRMGTAGALSLFKKVPKEPFFVVNGDLLTNLNFEEMLDFHSKQNSKATMCIKAYNVKSAYGEVKLNQQKIISIEEKPIHKFFFNAGIYILDPEILKLIPKKFYNMTSLFKKIIEKKKKTISFPIGEYWLDIGSFNDYEKAKNDYDKNF